MVSNGGQLDLKQSLLFHLPDEMPKKIKSYLWKYYNKMKNAVSEKKRLITLQQDFMLQS